MFGSRKVGGNAQSIAKGRWLHHTSFLWDFDPANMAYLTNPARQPTYRNQRSHLEFLCTLREVLKTDVVPTREQLERELRAELEAHFTVEDVGIEEVDAILATEHRKSTKFLTL